MITPRGFDRLMAKLPRFRAAMRAAISAGALHVKGKIASYPPRRYGTQPFKSPRQAMGFFKRLHAGAIEVPYRRGQSPGSETLGRKWTIRDRDDGLTAVVGNNASYGPYVQDRDEQSLYHQKSGWVTVQDVREDEGPVVRDLMGQAIRSAWING